MEGEAESTEDGCLVAISGVWRGGQIVAARTRRNF